MLELHQIRFHCNGIGPGSSKSVASYMTLPLMTSTGSPHKLQNDFLNQYGIFFPYFAIILRIPAAPAGIRKPIPKDINPCFQSYGFPLNSQSSPCPIASVINDVPPLINIFPSNLAPSNAFRPRTAPDTAPSMAPFNPAMA